MELERRTFADDFTAGVLTSPHLEEPLFTLEQEWRADTRHLGGENNNSCVPNGTYGLRPFIRPRNGLIVPLLYNSDLGVYDSEDYLPPEGGRFLILMHPGNTIKDIVGCIASGIYKEHTWSVNDSRDAQALIMQAFNAGDKELIITSFDTKEIYAKGSD